jgi:N-methylhydantoinase A
VTDANLVLGYLADQARLGGEVVLERSLAEKAVLRIAGDLDIGIVEAALGLHEVANAEMARALRVVSVQRGMDPREFAMVAFGGAGPMHACALAEELGIETILVPRSGGVLSALGLAMAELRRDYVSPIIGSLDELDPGGLATTFARMQSEAQADLPSPVLRAQADLRYRGQSFELTVDANGDADELREAFHLAHERRHGYRMQDEPVEMVNARVVATVPGALPELSEAPSGVESEVDTRTAWFEGGRQPVPIHDRRRMGAGSTLEGPAIVEFPESTCVLRPGWRGEVDEVGSLVLRRS